MKVLVLSIMILVGPGAPDIHSIDWENFSYPWTEGLMVPDSPEKTFTLTDGTIPIERRADGSLSNMPVTLKTVMYGDLTGDGDEVIQCVFSGLWQSCLLHSFLSQLSRRRPWYSFRRSWTAQISWRLRLSSGMSLKRSSSSRISPTTRLQSTSH